MYIVGTSGHIDHGKTSLIRILTDIDCDRLPEEKAREMTIDIGFANMEFPRFGTVSIIDVPGHERFIRNMVAGAWGIDLALLVIALDDGWMLQTEDHFRVLQLLGIERIIVVINKIDLGDEEMIEMVKDEVRDRLELTKYNEADIVPVSSKTGEGIDNLKETMAANLRKLSKAPDSDKPYLFIDRVFSPRGIGTIVTGTLKNGVFTDNDSVIVLPAKNSVKIKKIESHYKELHEGVPSQRTALNISNVTQDELKRGDIICRNNFFTETDDAIAKITIMHENKKLKNNTYVEILAGTDSNRAKLIMLNDEENLTDEILVRLKFDAKTNIYPGESFILTTPGGYRIIGGGTVIIPHYMPAKHKRNIKTINRTINPKNINEIVLSNIAIRGSIKREDIYSSLPVSKRGCERIITELENEKKILTISGIVISHEYYTDAIASIKRVLKAGSGLNIKEISDRSKTDFEICHLLMDIIHKEETLIEKDGRYFTQESITEETLPESKKEIMAMAKKNGGDGIELDKVKDSMEKKEIGDLIKLGFLVSLDGNIVYHKDIYDDMKKNILDLFNTKDKITISEAKDSVNLSRKYIIPLLNRIENEGLLKRLGDFRIKV
ncbi:MAG: selenocysteine-specific translation elongation factor [Leptospirales bacterium]|nr:selenocysteine-specific translation elongation factor [Leptospirales bacterium]